MNTKSNYRRSPQYDCIYYVELAPASPFLGLLDFCFPSLSLYFLLILRTNLYFFFFLVIRFLFSRDFLFLRFLDLRCLIIFYMPFFRGNVIVELQLSLSYSYLYIRFDQSYKQSACLPRFSAQYFSKFIENKSLQNNTITRQISKDCSTSEEIVALQDVVHVYQVKLLQIRH